MSQNISSSRDWRKTEETTPGLKYTTLVILGLVLLGLLAFFIIKLWPQPIDRNGLVLLGVPGYQADLPGIPNEAEQRRVFGDTEFPFETETRELSSGEDLRSLPETLENLLGRDRDIDMAMVFVTAHGVSQVNVDAQAGNSLVSDGFLLDSDFNFSSTAGRIPIDSLVQAMEEVRAKNKLLLLDTAYFQSDIRFGMGVNEFPYLLAQALQDSEDDSLWVIHGSGLLQPSQVSYASSGSGSIFAKAVRESYLNLADQSIGNKDEPISLLRFYRRVVQASWAFAPQASQYAQTPVLLRGTVGFVDPAESSDVLEEADRVILFHRKLEVAEEASDEATDEDGAWNPISVPRSWEISRPLLAWIRVAPSWISSRRWVASPYGVASVRNARRTVWQDDDAKPKQDQDDPKSDDPADASASNQDESAQQESAAQDPPPATPDERAAQRLAEFEATYPDSWTELQIELHQIHRLVDQIRARQNPGEWSPVDFAPDHWNRWIMQIARLDERAIHNGASSEGFPIRVATARRMRQQLEHLQDRMNGRQVSSYSGEDGDIGLKVLSAWDDLVRFEQRGVANTWQTSDSLERDVVRALRTYHDVLFRAKYYVQLNEDLSFLVGTDLSSKTTQLITNVLPRHHDRFAKVNFGDRDYGFTDELNELESAATELKSAEDQIRQSMVAITDQIVQAEDDAEYLFGEQLCVALLRSPVVPLLGPEPVDTASRQQAQLSRVWLEEQLINLREKAEPDLPSENPELLLPGAKDFYGSTDAWRRALGRLQLRLSLCQLALEEPSDDDAAVSAIGEIRLPAGIDESNIADVTEKFREATHELQTLYSKIVRDGRELQAREPLNPLARRIASIVDARDEGVFATRAPGLPKLAFQHKKDAERIQFANDRFQFDPDHDEQYDWDTNQMSIKIPITIKGYEDDSIDVVVTEMQDDVFKVTSAGQLIEEGIRLPIEVAQSGDSFVNLTIEPLTDRANLPNDYEQSLPYLRMRVTGKQTSNPNSTSQAGIWITPPLPRFVDLLVENQDTQAWEPSLETGSVSLLNNGRDTQRNVYPDAAPIEVVRVKPYPSRDSRFNLRLVNRSGREVTAKIEMYAVELPDNYRVGQTDFSIGLLPGRVSKRLDHVPHPALGGDQGFMWRRITGRERSPLEPFAVSQEVTLPPAAAAFPNDRQSFGNNPADNGLAIPVSFAPPPPAEGEASPPPAAEPAAPTPLPHGIFCKITVNGWKASEVTTYRWIEFTPAMPSDYLGVLSGEREQPSNVNYDSRARRIDFDMNVGQNPKWPQQSSFPWGYFQEITVDWFEPSELRRFPREYVNRPTVIKPNERGRMSWKLPVNQSPTSPWRTYFDVDGYPRALAFDINVDGQDAKGTFSRLATSEVRIHRVIATIGDEEKTFDAFDNDTVRWMARADRLRFEYRIDGPIGAMFVLDEAELITGKEEFIDLRLLNGDQTLERVIRYFDRELSFSGLIDKSGRLTVKTQVSDLSHEVTGTRITPNVPITVRATLNVGSEATDQEVGIGFDIMPPVIDDIVWERSSGPGMVGPRDASGSIGKNDSIALVVSARDDHSGISESGIEFYLDINKDQNDRWFYDPAKKLGEQLPEVIEEGRRWRFIVSGKELGLRNHRIVPRVLDNVGVEGVFSGNPINVVVVDQETVIAESSTGGGKPANTPKSYTIRLKVVLRNRPLSGKPDSIQVDDSDVSYSEVSDSEGFTYEIKDVKPGAHKIKVSYEDSLRTPFEKELSIDIKPDEASPVLKRTVVLQEVDDK